MTETRSQMRQRKKGAEGDTAEEPAAQPTDEQKVEEAEEEEIIYKNGKAYKKRKDLPDVGYLITYGVPGKEGRNIRDPSKPWWHDFYLPSILLVLFVLSLIAFHHIPFSPRARPKFSLQDIRDRKAQQDQMKKMHEQVEFP